MSWSYYVDDITTMAYDSLLPKGIDSKVKNVRIKQYCDWKGHSYVPKRMAKAISWSSKTPFKQRPMERQSEWKIIKLSLSPLPSKLLEAKLLIAQVDSKAKAKSKSTKKAAKSAKSKVTTKDVENNSSDIEVVEDGSKLETVK